MPRPEASGIGVPTSDDHRSVGKKSKAMSPMIKDEIESARKVQAKRFGEHRAKITTNSEMSSRQVEDVVKFEPGAEKFLETLGHSRLSPRGYYRLLKVARTIADLEHKEKVSEEHLAEAFSYRLREEV